MTSLEEIKSTDTVSTDILDEDITPDSVKRTYEKGAEPTVITIRIESPHTKVVVVGADAS
jgi:hypothetical protein